MMNSMGKQARRAFTGLVLGLMLGLLAACGGGTEQITPFAPTRMFAFGDEMSVLTKELPQGRKYTVNAMQSDAVTIDCSATAAWLWTQAVANLYLFAFEECNPLNLEVRAFSYAAPGATTEGFLVQLEAARVARGPFTSTDLMTVLVGANDVLNLYRDQYVPDPAYAANYKANPTYQAIITELTARGTRLGQAITALTDNNGPRVILSTIPMLNLSPFALSEAAARPNANVRNILEDFCNTFNTAVRVNIPNDGRRWGLVELDAMIQAGVDNPANYGLTNWTQAACSVALPDCNNVPADLVANANASTWLWASDLWIGWQAHRYLGNFARGRVLGNPF
jgi:outer membrane lipase/esterase